MTEFTRNDTVCTTFKFVINILTDESFSYCRSPLIPISAFKLRNFFFIKVKCPQFVDVTTLSETKHTWQRSKFLTVTVTKLAFCRIEQRYCQCQY
jgi:hypothetical protein